jgi:hypothetical protein
MYNAFVRSVNVPTRARPVAAMRGRGVTPIPGTDIALKPAQVTVLVMEARNRDIKLIKENQERILELILELFSK